jgi:aspartyl/asparaginyl beta-hydroxylase (cupin superfamily)
MSTPDSLSAAVALARSGDLGGARDMVRRIVAGPGTHADGWMLLSQIAERTGDADDQRAALVAVLRLAPRHLPALLARGALERRANDERTAMRFFRTALAVASASPPPPDLHPALTEAQAFVMAASARFTATVEAALADAGLTTRAPPRVTQAIDLLLGRTELHLQQPSMFYYPGLAQRAFFEREEFAWVPDVERRTDAIRDELNALLADGDHFQPYVTYSANAPAPANHLLESADWSASYLFEGGQPHAVNAPPCPETMAALAAAPQPVIGSRSPMALFSRLTPGTHIRPHHGMLNTRLICHLPLVVPGDCALRVGAETREWREGELLIFDDSFEHEAWNRGSSDRVVLLFEIWRPEIDADERRAITTLLNAVEAHGMDDAD